MTYFNPESYLPRSAVNRITDLRVNEPRLASSLAAKRPRRAQLAPDGRLVIGAADHPARHVVRAGSDPDAMADRGHYLSRIVRVLTQPEVDGLMATADLIDELLLLNHLLTSAGGPDFLAGKVLVGSMNRGGLAGARFELDDTMTGYSPEGLATLGLDGGKVLLRLNLDEPDAARTMLYCTEAVEGLRRLGLPAFVEALPVERTETGGWRVSTAPAKLIGTVGVATAMGSSSAGMWLKLPMVPEMARVAAATTCPILLLGGDSQGDPDALFARVAASMAAGANVRGLMIGRSVFYPGDGEDPAAVAVALSRIVRGTWDAATASEGLAALRGRDLDLFEALR